ncbi:hypothetical protein EAF00_009304 [Botryotinia globosa]|nr:hypothetical protein EAF00_009304 [Botryotinia globosa]
MSFPPEEPQPQDSRLRIRSPDRIHRWIEGIGEFNQPISPSNNLPDSPPSGNPYDLHGVDLRSPSIGSRPGAPQNVFAATLNPDDAQTGAGFTANNQQPNPEAANASNALLGQMTTHHNLVGQIQQRNEHLLGNMYELSPIPNSGDHAHAAIPAGNNNVEDAPNLTLLQYRKMNTSPTSSELADNDIIDNQNNALLNVFPDSPYAEFRTLDQRAYQADTATGMMNTMNNYSFQPGSGGLQPPDQRAYQADTATGMMNIMNDYSAHMNRHTTIIASMADHSCQPLRQRARQFNMATGMMNPMNNYQGGMHGQVPENNPASTYHIDYQNDVFGNNPQYPEVQQNVVFENNPQYPEVQQNVVFENNPQYPEVQQNDDFENNPQYQEFQQNVVFENNPQYQEFQQNVVFENNPQYQEFQQNDFFENNPQYQEFQQNDIFGNNPQYPEVQQNDHMLNNYNIDSTQQAVQSSGDNMPADHLPGTAPQQNILESIEHPPHNPQPNASPQQVHYVDESDDVFTTPTHSLTTPSQNMAVPHTPSGSVSGQRAPGAVGMGLSMPNAPGNISSGQHVVQNEQGFDVPDIPDNMPPNQNEVFNNQGLGGPNAPGDTPSNQYEVANDEDNMLPNQHVVHSEQDLAVPNVPDNMPPNQQIAQQEQDLYMADAPDNMPPNQHIVQHEQDLAVPNVPDNMPPNQQIAQQEQDLYMADAPDNMPPNQHIDQSNQGEMPTSGGDQMDTSEDQIQFGKLSTVAPLAQLFDLFLDAPQPSNTINSGPFFPQDTSSRQPLQLDRNPTATSNVEETEAALDSGEAGTRSARIFPPNIPGTLAPSMHQAQMEAPQTRNQFKHPARNDKSDTRKDPPQDANRVNKSIRRKKPAKTQKLQSAIANSASQLLEESASQAAEAQNNPENSKSQAIEAQDESETSVES